MRIAIYGRQFSDEHVEQVSQFFEDLASHSAEISIYDTFEAYLRDRIALKNEWKTFSKEGFDPKNFDVFISVGGDGTLLDSTTFIRDSGLPMLGINTGRLGFLSSIGLEHAMEAMGQIIKGAYRLDKRSMIKLETEQGLFGEANFALNEVTVHKKDTQSMIVIHAYVDGKFLNTYWADGLIIATPTGSTAYSLSCGGPIILPNSANFIITPVAPHNLNVRPVLISDESVVTLRIEGRSSNILVSLDSRSTSVETSTVLTLMKHEYEINLIRLKNHSFLKTLRTKLHWGYDRRN